MAKKNKSHVISAKKLDMKVEKIGLEKMTESCFEENQLLALDECPRDFFLLERKEKGIASAIKFGSFLQRVDEGDGEVNKIATVKNNSVIRVEFLEINLTGLLDSGEFRSVRNGKHKSRYDKLKTLDKPIRVQAARGVVYPIHEVGLVIEMDFKSENPGLNTFKPKDVDLIILEVPEWAILFYKMTF
eukprot:snap_masked-scaffold_70-processed-gene-0.74-mRNA-1 protein AED:1.00 eAED:1.00 QI:0/0/0/0/1/1/2/0/186